MTVQATDRPDTNSVARSGIAYVTIIVRRNENGPVFSPTLYNVTISEYLSVQRSVISTTANDDDISNVSTLEIHSFNPSLQITT